MEDMLWEWAIVAGIASCAVIVGFTGLAVAWVCFCSRDYVDGMSDAFREAEAGFLDVVVEEGIPAPTLPTRAPPPSDCGNYHPNREG